MCDVRCRYIAAYYSATARELRRLQSIARSMVYAQFAETTDGSASVRAFGLQQAFCNRLEEYVATLQQASLTGGSGCDVLPPSHHSTTH
jgi:ATP-binding cassette, subfamily C (CFTR/MRP), member 10